MGLKDKIKDALKGKDQGEKKKGNGARGVNSRENTEKTTEHISDELNRSIAELEQKYAAYSRNNANRVEEMGNVIKGVAGSIDCAVVAQNIKNAARAKSLLEGFMSDNRELFDNKTKEAKSNANMPNENLENTTQQKSKREAFRASVSISNLDYNPESYNDPNDVIRHILINKLKCSPAIAENKLVQARIMTYLMIEFCGLGFFKTEEGIEQASNKLSEIITVTEPNAKKIELRDTPGTIGHFEINNKNELSVRYVSFISNKQTQEDYEKYNKDGILIRQERKEMLGNNTEKHKLAVYNDFGLLMEKLEETRKIGENRKKNR